MTLPKPSPVVDVPEPGPGKVLVKVHASSLNAADHRLMRATPFLARLGNGLFRPKKWRTLGVDVAGVVERVGEGVQRVSIGDAVFADAFRDGLGAFAEYVCLSESAVVRKPENLTFDEAATVPLAGVTALQGLRDRAEVKPGDEVLIQGAGGGVGTFVVQLAKHFGAHVTAVCGSGSAQLMQEFGADRVIDYATIDFTEEDARYDVIVAVNGYHSIGEYKRCLKPGGRYVMVGGDNRQLFEGLLLAPIRFLGSGRSARVLDVDDSRVASDLETLGELLAARALRPVIDRRFALDQMQDAMRYLEKGHVRGKVVIQVAA
jgi:NADPH:quinone reductase-like Zn-dependent oxidoreductase